MNLDVKIIIVASTLRVVSQAIIHVFLMTLGLKNAARQIIGHSSIKV